MKEIRNHNGDWDGGTALKGCYSDSLASTVGGVDDDKDGSDQSLLLDNTWPWAQGYNFLHQPGGW
jgi:hypothetical protein